jgi:uncharacterized protein YneF (UPF0154 family)
MQVGFRLLLTKIVIALVRARAYTSSRLGGRRTVSGKMAIIGLIVLVLVGIAGFYGRRQWRALRALPTQDLPPADRAHFRSQAVRRLLTCGVMLLLAGMIAGIYLSGLDEQVAQQLAENAQTHDALQAEANRPLYRLYVRWWVGILLLVFALLILAGLDLWATRRYAVRHLHQLRADHRAELDIQVARLRRERRRE